VPGEPARVIYRTATSLDGFIADDANSLAWLFAVEHDDAQQADHDQFLEHIGVLVAGSTTYEWVFTEADLLDEPEKWQAFYGERPMFVFTTRELPRPPGADVRFVAGSVQEALPAIRAAAAGGDIWVVGGGDLAGQFLDAGALDRIEVSIAPVTLSAGAPLFPRRVESTRLQLRNVLARAQFIVATFAVGSPPA
jgi:dihydrofolate reductase